MASRRSGTRPQDFSVSDLLEWIDDQELVLPEFQRDYNWSDDRVIALAATIMRGWPAGSLLLQELGDTQFFALRAFTDGPELDEGVASLVVLDGQQRLTGLYHALYDVGPSVYAIKASCVTTDSSVDELEEAMASFDRDAWDDNYRHGPFEPDNDWIPLYALRSSSDYFAWRDDIVKSAPNPDVASVEIADAFRNGLERFQKYRFPAVIVEAGLEPAAIARIFERVNRQGLALKTFDLMVARTFITDWNLRDRWTEACIEYPVLDRFFADDGMPVIRSIALASLANVREQAVLTLEPTLVRLDWEDCVSATARAAEFLENCCGVRDPSWVPYGGVVVTLAALEREWSLAERGDTVRKWFLSRCVGLSFESGANTVTVEEYRHLRRVFAGDEDLRRVSVSARMIKEATRRRQGALWRSFLCCLALSNGDDVGLGQDDEEYATVATAIFEKKSSPRGLEPTHHLVLNQVLASRDEARDISNIGIDRFSDYLADLPRNIRSKVIRAQLLPDVQAGMSEDEFIQARLGIFGRWLRKQLGYGIAD